MTAVPQVIGGLLNEVGAMIFDAINVLASAASFITRTLSTLFNFGYGINIAERSQNGREGINILMGFSGAYFGCFREIDDAIIYESTTSLSN